MPEPGPPKILVVDDEAAIRQLLVEVLSDEGYSVYVAANGQDAMVMVGQDRPDLILMDVMMPEMDGPATVRHLRASPGFDSVPVILMSAAHHLARDIKDDVTFVNKPFNLEDLLDVVARLLHPSGNGP